MYMCACAKSLQSRLTLFNPIDCSPPGYSVHGILQARILEWTVMCSSRGSSRPGDQTRVSCGSRITGGFFTTGPLEKPHTYIRLVANINRLTYSNCSAPSSL